MVGRKKKEMQERKGLVRTAFQKRKTGQLKEVWSRAGKSTLKGQSGNVEVECKGVSLVNKEKVSP